MGVGMLMCVMLDDMLNYIMLCYKTCIRMVSRSPPVVIVGGIGGGGGGVDSLYDVR